MKPIHQELTPEMVEAERVKFEAWCDAEGIDASYWLRCDKRTGYENGRTAEGIDASYWLRCDKRTGYENGRTADYWTGWKARAMHGAASEEA